MIPVINVRSLRNSVSLRDSIKLEKYIYKLPCTQKISKLTFISTQQITEIDYTTNLHLYYRDIYITFIDKLQITETTQQITVTQYIHVVLCNTGMWFCATQQFTECGFVQHNNLQRPPKRNSGFVQHNKLY